MGTRQDTYRRKTIPTQTHQTHALRRNEEGTHDERPDNIPNGTDDEEGGETCTDSAGGGGKQQYREETKPGRDTGSDP